ncbi:hypothetical protein ACFY8V_05175 [Streptomyces californicus]|uniref:hypothetical protein n=1 Tax=Streptomyces californicus TaxID=67351 RepID=UPI0036B6E3F7
MASGLFLGHGFVTVTVADVAELAVVSVFPEFGLRDSFADFMRVIEDAPTLKARLWYLQQEVLQSVVATLREDTGAGEDDPLPLLVGGQIAWIEGALVGYVSQEMMKGRKAVDVSHDGLAALTRSRGCWADRSSTTRGVRPCDASRCDVRHLRRDAHLFTAPARPTGTNLRRRVV